jgi:hypothetical protein
MNVLAPAFRPLYPLDDRRIVRVYAAGKIGPNDWRPAFDGVPDSGASYDNYVRRGELEHDVPLPHGAPLGEVRLVYVGPWYIDGSNCHVSYHGRSTHGLGIGGASNAMDAPTPDLVLDNALGQIRRADVVYVRLDAPDCFGTLTEVGYAAALGKPFVVDVVGDAPAEDMWFPIRLALRKRPDAHVEALVRRAFSGAR